MQRRLLVVALPVAFLVGFVTWLGVDLPFWDEWYFVPELDAYARGETSWLELAWLPHCEHRMLIPKGVYGLLWPALGWSIPLLLVLNVAFVAAFVMWIVKRIELDVAAALMVACVLLNPHAWENWLWAWQFQIHASVVFGCLGLYFSVYHSARWAWVLAVTLFVMSAYSFVAGFAFAAAGSIAWLRERRWRRAGVALGIVVGAGILHLATLPSTAYQVGVLDPAKQLASAGLLVLEYLATPVVGASAPSGLARMVGALVAVLILVITLREFFRPPAQDEGAKARRFARLVCIAAIGCGILIALGRVGLEGSGRSSRYVSFGALAWVGFAILASRRSRRDARDAASADPRGLPLDATRDEAAQEALRPRASRAASLLLAAASLAALIISSPASITSARNRSQAMQNARTALVAGTGLSHETLSRVFNDHRSLGKRVAMLREHGWCGLEQTAPEAGPDASVELSRKAQTIEVRLRGIPAGNMASLVAHHGKERVPLWVRKAGEDTNKALQIPAVPKGSGWKLELEWMDRRARLRSVVVDVD